MEDIFIENIKSAIKFNKSFRNEGFVSDLKMQRVNGQRDRVCGFVSNPDNGKIQYINIDCGRLGITPSLQFMHRTAESIKDYTGGRNIFSRTSKDLIREVIEALS